MIPALGTAIETCRVTAGGAAAFSFDRLVVSCLVVLLVMYVIREWSMGLDDDGLLDDGSTFLPDLDDSVEEDSESLRAELEELGQVEEVGVPSDGVLDKDLAGEAILVFSVIMLTVGSLGLFALFSGGFDHTVTEGHVEQVQAQSMDGHRSSTFLEDLRDVAQFTNGVVGGVK